MSVDDQPHRLNEANLLEQLAMSDIDKLCETFAELGIDHTRREIGEYEYVFVGECRNLHNPDWDFATADLGSLLRGHDFFEFESGKLASYSSS